MESNLKTAYAAYAAGLLDGEGCFSISTRDRTAERGFLYPLEYRGEVSIGMTNPKAVTWMHQTFGGFLREKPAQKANWKPQWHWKLGDSAKILALIDVIHPYLQVKWSQAMILQEFAQFRLLPDSDAKQALLGAGKYRELHECMAILNKKGVECVT